MTNRSKYFNSLDEEKDIVRNLTDQLPVGIVRTTCKGQILYVNPALAKMFEYSLNEMYDISAYDLFLEREHRDYEIKSIIASGDNKIVREKTLKTKNQKRIIVKATINIIRNKKGDIDYFDGVVEDITVRKKAEKEILKLSTAVTQSPNSIVITDLKGNIEYVNPKFCELTGYSTEDLIGKNPRILKTEHSSDKFYKNLWQTISSGKTWRGEFLNKRKNGTYFWELASINPIFDKKGNIVQYLGIKEDITKRKEIEEALLKSEQKLKHANATKDVFFSIVAHDLKGPIGNFSQLLNIIKENFYTSSNDEKLEYINMLVDLSKKTNNLLDDLLLWARIQMNAIEFEKENCHLLTIVNQSVSIVNEKTLVKNINIEIDVDSKIEVYANIDSIKTVVRNLLSNAIKFSTQKSKIQISAKEDKVNGLVKVSIKDFGVGIPKENLDRLFKIETSFSTYGTEDEKGSGLGLILCRELIRKNGGEIKVQSTENKGSTFYFIIPNKT